MMTKEQIFEKYARHVSSQKAKFFRDVGIDFVFGRREGPSSALRQQLSDRRSERDLGAGNRRPSLGGKKDRVALRYIQLPDDRQRLQPWPPQPGGHCGDAKYREPFLSSSSDFSQVPFNDIETLKEALNDSPAAVIFETIPATLGMPIPGNDYYIQVKHLCEKNGTLLIIDEFQTGLGRHKRPCEKWPFVVRDTFCRETFKKGLRKVPHFQRPYFPVTVAEPRTFSARALLNADSDTFVGRLNLSTLNA